MFAEAQHGEWGLPRGGGSGHRGEKATQDAKTDHWTKRDSMQELEADRDTSLSANSGHNALNFCNFGIAAFVQVTKRTE